MEDLNAITNALIIREMHGLSCPEWLMDISEGNLRLDHEVQEIYENFYITTMLSGSFINEIERKGENHDKDS